MKNNIYFSLKNKLVLVNLVIVVFFASSIVYVYYLLSTDTLIAQKRELVTTMAQGQVRELDYVISRPAKVVGELAANPVVAEYFDRKSKVNDESIFELFKSISTGREYSNVYLMNTKGDVVVSVDSTFLNNNFAFRDYFAKAIEGKSHIQIAFGTLTKKPGYYYSAPVKSGDSVVGVVVIKVNTEYIHKVLAESPINTIGHIFLTDEYGIVVYTDKDLPLYQSMGPIVEATREKIVAYRTFEGYGITPLQYQVAQEVIDDYIEPKLVDYEDLVDNEKEVLLVSKVADNPFFVVVEGSYESVFSQVGMGLWPIIIVMAGAVVAGVILQYLVFMKLLAPLKSLEKFTKEVAEGNLNETINVNTNDELESLSESIKSMIDSLVESRSGLEDRVEKQTIELKVKLEELTAKNNQMALSETAMLNILEDEKELEKQLAIEKTGVEKKIVERTKQLADEEAKLMAAISALPRAFVILDAKLNIVSQNGRLEGILGKIDGQWSVSKIDALLGGKFGFELMVKQTIEEMKNQETENTFGSKYLRVFMAPVIGQSNELIGVVITIKDATEDKVIERSKDEFFSIASHELRTPLTAIRGNSSMMLDYYKDVFKDPELKQMMEDVHEGSVRLIGIVNDFLDMSRLEMGKVEYKIEDVKMFSIVEKVMSDLSENAKLKKVELKITGDSNLIAMADVGKVEQILFNIIGNSLKFTDKGSISINLSKVGTQMQIEVVDTGIGIPEVNQPLLFHKFQQASDSIMTREGAKGTGLGLYISRLMAEAMGGKLDLIKSEVGKGSTFALSLPAKEK